MSTTWTQAHLESIQTAILSLSSGSEVEEVETPGRRIKYFQTDLPQLLKLFTFVEGRVLAAEASATAGGNINKVVFNDAV